MSSQIQVGNTIPAVGVKELAADKAEPLVLKGKNVIVGVPGAFTATCHAQVPGYINLYNEFKEKGVSGIYVITVNDVFVTKAWKDVLAPLGTPIHFIADDLAEFAKSIGLSFDATPVLGGHRSLRYVIITEDDKVTSIFVEPQPGAVTVTSAQEILTKV